MNSNGNEQHDAAAGAQRDGATQRRFLYRPGHHNTPHFQHDTSCVQNTRRRNQSQPGGVSFHKKSPSCPMWRRSQASGNQTGPVKSWTGRCLCPPPRQNHGSSNESTGSDKSPTLIKRGRAEKRGEQRTGSETASERQDKGERHTRSDQGGPGPGQVSPSHDNRSRSRTGSTLGPEQRPIKNLEARWRSSSVLVQRGTQSDSGSGWNRP